MINTTVNPERSALKSALLMTLEHYEIGAGLRKPRFVVAPESLESRIDAEAKRQWKERQESKQEILATTLKLLFSLGWFPRAEKAQEEPLIELPKADCPVALAEAA